MGNCKPITYEKVNPAVVSLLKILFCYLADSVSRLLELCIYLPSKGRENQSPLSTYLTHFFFRLWGVSLAESSLSKLYKYLNEVQLPLITNPLAMWTQHLLCSSPDVSIGSLWESVLQNSSPVATPCSRMNTWLRMQLVMPQFLTGWHTFLYSISAISPGFVLLLCIPQVSTSAYKKGVSDPIINECQAGWHF